MSTREPPGSADSIIVTDKSRLAVLLGGQGEAGAPGQEAGGWWLSGPLGVLQCQCIIALVNDHDRKPGAKAVYSFCYNAWFKQIWCVGSAHP